MMNKFGLGLVFLLMTPAFAADNSVIVTPGTGVTMRSKDIGAGVESMVQILGDTSGNPIYGTAGTANANILTVQGIASMTPFLVTLPTGASTSANQSTEITSLATIATNTGAAIPVGTNSIGTVGLNAGTNVVGNVGLTANATGGCTPGHTLSATTNNSTNVKASAGTLCSLTVINTTTTLGDLRIYDSATAPTCSSATGVVANFAIQSNATSPGITVNLGPYGMKFSNGIGFCFTGAVADNDNTNFVTGAQVNYSWN
jgi:hypothetical protein